MKVTYLNYVYNMFYIKNKFVATLLRMVMHFHLSFIRTKITFRLTAFSVDTYISCKSVD
jgi:hypothetical protein